MGSKAIVFSCLSALVLVMIASEVSARDLAEEETAYTATIGVDGYGGGSPGGLGYGGRGGGHGGGGGGGGRGRGRGHGGGGGGGGGHGGGRHGGAYGYGKGGCECCGPVQEECYCDC